MKQAVLAPAPAAAALRTACGQEPSGFGLDNFSVHGDFEENGAIGLLIYYAPPRFQETD